MQTLDKSGLRVQESFAICLVRLAGNRLPEAASVWSNSEFGFVLSKIAPSERDNRPTGPALPTALHQNKAKSHTSTVTS